MFLERCYEGLFVFRFMRLENSFFKELRILVIWNKVKYNVIMIKVFVLFEYEGKFYKQENRSVQQFFFDVDFYFEKLEEMLFLWIVCVDMVVCNGFGVSLFQEIRF